MYPQSLSTTEQVDQAFYIIFGISAVVLILITVTMLYFVYKYHQKRHPVASQIHGSMTAELIWTIIPSILVIGMFYVGWDSYKALRSVPDDAMEVAVKSRMWSFRFEYPNGKTSDTLIVPVNKPVKLNIESSDVIHSFYVPAFRIKVDAVPGMTTYTWLESDKTGSYDIFCAEYCGLKHADMITTVSIIPEDEFATWYAGNDAAETADGSAGQKLFEDNGCLDCHTLDGEELVGPTFKDIFNRKTIVLKDGKEVEIVADRNYLKESILDPEAQIVKGYEPMMPPYEGEISDADLNGMLDYYEKGSGKPKLDGRKVLAEEGCMDCHSTDGTVIAGPSFKNIIMRKTTVIENGKPSEIYANKSYIIESIFNPEQKLVEGYDPMMPPYEEITSDQMDAIIEYFESISEEKLSTK